MSSAKPGRPLPRIPVPVTLLFIVILAATFLSACTRAEVFSAVSTAVVEYQATSDARSVAGATGASSPSDSTEGSEVQTGEPPLLATEPVPTQAVVATVPDERLPEGEPTPTLAPPTAKPAEATAPPSATPLPMATDLPTETPPPTPTPPATTVPSPTPWPTEIASRGALMVLVPGGVFEMGQAAVDALAECNTFRAGCQEDWFAAAEPVHPVNVDPIYMDATEVTNLAYVTFLNEVGDHLTACEAGLCFDLEQSQIQVSDGIYEVDGELANHPAAGVTWAGAAAYCQWRGGRLPTEAEWEKAATWEDATETKRAYPWGDAFDGTLVNFCDASCDAPQADADTNDGFPEAAPVGSYPDGASPSGLLDMAGNVWEWTADWFAPESYQASIGADNPTGPEEGEARVVRGGSWFDTGNFTAGTIRFPSPPDNADKTIGFRCAQEP